MNNNLIDVDVELFALIFFWVALWKIITIIINWLLVQMNAQNNIGIEFLVYIILVICSLYVINLNKKNKEEEDKNK